MKSDIEMHKSILILGANGFLGSNLMKKFSAYHFDVLGVKRQFRPNDADSEWFINYDQLLSEDFSSTLGNFSAIIFALGNPSLLGRPARSEEYLMNQIISHLNKVNFGGLFILLSSNAVDAAFKSKGSNKLVPNLTRYGTHKLSLEEIVKSNANFQYLIFRCPSVLAPNMKSSSHIKRISLSRRIQLILRLPFVKGNLQVTSVDALFDDIMQNMQTVKNYNTVLYPRSIELSLKAIESLLNQRLSFPLLKTEYRSKRPDYILKFLLPKALSYLFIPHWNQTKINQENDQGDLLYSILNLINQMKNRASLKSQNVIVSGCSSGLGREVSLLLLQRGISVIGIDRSLPDEFTRNVFQSLGEFNFYQIDITSATFETTLNSLFSTFNISGIVACHGYAQKRTFNDTEIAMFQNSWYAHFLSIVLMLRTINLTDSGIFLVSIGSSSGIIGLPLFADYSASKAALHSLFQSLINDANYTNRFLLLIPSGMRTQFQDRAGIPMTERKMKFLLRPEKIAKVIVDWAEDDNRKSKISLVGFSARILSILSAAPIELYKKVLANLSKKLHS